MNVAIEPSTVGLADTELSEVAPLVGTLFQEMGIAGVYARTPLYEKIVAALGVLVDAHRPDGAEILRFPPVMSRRDVERSGYLKSFPNLLGCVSVLNGPEKEIQASVANFERGGDWTGSLASADLVLSPAACYPVYPRAAQRGPVPRSGWMFDVACDCFRREPSSHPDRLQSFRMREYVHVGSPADVDDFRAQWMTKAEGLADSLGLSAKIAPANDPFFGREGQMRSVSQIQHSLKFELLIPTWSASRPTACMSFNCHRDHFAAAWDIRDETGALAHTACVAFGMDRLALAVFCAHGADVENWPENVRHVLKI